MKELLFKIGWTQGRFARELGTSPNTVSNWCVNSPDTVAFRAAMKYLECMARSMGR